jgi:hypothetical protein
MKFYNKYKKLKIFLSSLTLIVVVSCNPFAPGIGDDFAEGSLLSDGRTVEGLFQNWALSYNYRDTTIYSSLLHEDFLFEYTDYELSQIIPKTKAEDIRATSNMFNSSIEDIRLLWNESTNGKQSDSLFVLVNRNFSLQITYSFDDIETIIGRAQVTLVRDSAHQNWQILRWVDEAN